MHVSGRGESRESWPDEAASRTVHQAKTRQHSTSAHGMTQQCLRRAWWSCPRCATRTCSYGEVVVTMRSSPCTLVVLVVTAVIWPPSRACFSISAICCRCCEGGVISAPRMMSRISLCRAHDEGEGAVRADRKHSGFCREFQGATAAEWNAAVAPCCSRAIHLPG